MILEYWRTSFHWLSILATLSLATAGAQEQIARLVKDANRSPGDFRAVIDWVMPMGKGVVFPMDTLAHGSELWTSDGTAKGTRLLKDLLPGPGSSYPKDPLAFGAGAGARVAFSCEREGTVDDLWVTDGTHVGTVRIHQSDVLGLGSNVFASAGTTNGVFFFDLNWDLDDSFELFFSDGTEAGTRSLNPMAGESRARFSMPYSLVSSGSSCYFIANENEIWRSDGTDAGTTKVISITEGWPNRLALAGDRLFMEMASDPDTTSLWTCQMDGSALTRLGPPPGTRWQTLHQPEPVGDRIFFMVEGPDEHGIYARLLWTSDGTEAGTRRIRLENPGSAADSTLGYEFTSWNGAIYLIAQGGDNASELWRTDGSPAGTTRIASFPKNTLSLLPYQDQPSGDFLHFLVWREPGHWDLWRTRGDSAGARRVRGTPAINPLHNYLPVFAAGEAGLFFPAQQGTGNEALWRLRGTAGGSVRLTQPEKSSGSSLVSYTFSLPYQMLGADLLQFVHTGREDELWRMNPDGSRARSIWKPPVPLQDYRSLEFRGTIGHRALFTFSDGSAARQVWATDGTRRGTTLLADHRTGSTGEYLHDFVEVGGVIFYSVTNESDRRKASLWKTDGTPSGTSKVVAADGTSPGPDAWEMVAFEGNLYFLATDTDRKTSLWRSDGTAAGTVRLKQEWYGYSGETAACLSTAGGSLFFSVRLTNTDVLWRSDGTSSGTLPVNPLATFSRLTLSPVVNLGGVALFQAQDRISPPYLRWWCHDSTSTRTVTTYTPGQHLYHWYRGDESRQAVAGSQLFYVGIKDYEADLWVTDGTPDGTRRVKDIDPGLAGPTPGEMLAVGNQIYFTASDDGHGQELWRSDGTEAGTVLVADIEPGPADSSPGGLKVMGNKLYFTANRRDIGRELFTVDLPER